MIIFSAAIGVAHAFGMPSKTHFHGRADLGHRKSWGFASSNFGPDNSAWGAGVLEDSKKCSVE